jgi:hypothetical protein
MSLGFRNDNLTFIRSLFGKQPGVRVGRIDL